MAEAEEIVISMCREFDLNEKQEEAVIGLVNSIKHGKLKVFTENLFFYFLCIKPYYHSCLFSKHYTFSVKARV